MRTMRAAAVLATMIVLAAAAPREGTAMSRKPNAAPSRPAPPIDGERPAETRVADFALG
ncbi:MAG: hypothetical protein JW958_13710 [Candidatus Eisenbacteria bacterium]|nr:hypothetical protein [Candidatus Eisenbacteria bacterium]